MKSEELLKNLIKEGMQPNEIQEIVAIQKQVEAEKKIISDENEKLKESNKSIMESYTALVKQTGFTTIETGDPQKVPQESLEDLFKKYGEENKK